jgi:hypothetical protein
MDTKRLEELADRLMLGEFTIEDQRDAARCAKAWAKVERILRTEDGYSVDLWRMRKGHIRMLTNHFSVDGDTAIAAVEAEPEVKL